MSSPRVRKTYRWQLTSPSGRVLGWLVIAAGAVSFVDQAFRLERASSATTVTGTAAEVRLHITWVLRSPLAFALVPIVIAAEVMWLIWQHKVNADLWARGVEGLRFTPGWSVGWWFIPFANFLQPFRAVRELSHRVGRSGTPGQDEPPAVSDGILSLWWVSHLLYWLLSLLALVILFREVWPPIFRGWSTEANATIVSVRGSDLHAVAWWFFASACVRVVSALLAARVVWAISRAEDSALLLIDVPPRPDR